MTPLDFVKPNPAPRIVTIAAKPGPVTLDLARSALIVVDMQNDFLHPDGWFPKCGHDPAALTAIIPPLMRTIHAWRAAALPVIWLNWGVRADLANIPAVVLQKAGVGGRPVYADPSPSRRGRILVEGDWGAALFEPLKAEPGDIVVHKHRLSGFWDNELDAILRKHGIDALLFAGINIDRCVFSSLTDAVFLGYGCLLVDDLCATASPAAVRESILYLVHLLYGASTDSTAVLAALEEKTLAPIAHARRFPDTSIEQ